MSLPEAAGIKVQGRTVIVDVIEYILFKQMVQCVLPEYNIGHMYYWNKDRGLTSITKEGHQCTRHMILKDWK